jgi:tRNA(Ile)-lysidine synthase
MINFADLDRGRHYFFMRSNLFCHNTANNYTMKHRPLSMLAKKVAHLLDQYNVANKRILLAVSGGVDSMVLAAVLVELNIDFAMAHCNFHLRGAESEGDEQLVVQWAKSYNIPYFVQHFETQKILNYQGGNLQELARNLRYSWFEQLCSEHQYPIIATAHHADDAIETLLMNFCKGTGINGLHGIQAKKDKIIRPLIDATRADIMEYALENNVVWRDDSSNSKLTYTRNKVRHELLPLLRNIFPQVDANLRSNIQRFAEIGLIYQSAMDKLLQKIVEKQGEEYCIPVRKLTSIEALHTVLFEIIKPFGFVSAQVGQVAQLLRAESGKFVSSATHRVIRNRKWLIIAPLKTESATFIVIDSLEHADGLTLNSGNFTMQIKQSSFDGQVASLAPSANIAHLNLDQVEFPMILRPWKQGDYFYPLGMKKKKKVARFLIDQKVPMHQKERVWVLESNKRIVWVVGYRIDDRFKVLPQQSNLLQLSIQYT